MSSDVEKLKKYVAIGLGEMSGSVRLSMYDLYVELTGEQQSDELRSAFLRAPLTVLLHARSGCLYLFKHGGAPHCALEQWHGSIEIPGKRARRYHHGMRFSVGDLHKDYDVRAVRVKCKEVPSEYTREAESAATFLDTYEQVLEDAFVIDGPRDALAVCRPRRQR